MPDLGPRQIVAWIAGAAVLAVLGVVLLRHSGASGAPLPAVRVDGAGGGGDGGAGGPGGRVFVHVAGAVRRPGLYRLRAGARVADALDRAGGARPRADLNAVNLAARVEDGRQVLVPTRGAPGSTTAAGGSATAGLPPGTPGAPPAPPVDLNTATLEQLDTLDGVGPITAQKILAYRQEHGGFGSVEELGEIPGIGPKRLAALRDHVRV